MKKAIILLLALAFGWATFGAILQTVKNVQQGEVAIAGTGKLTAVDVFSDNATGTVKIERVFTMSQYTNAIDTTSAIVTNVVETKHYDDVFYRGDGVVFTNIGVKAESNYCWEMAAEGHKGLLMYNIVGNVWWYNTEWNESNGDYDLGSKEFGYNFDSDYIKFGTGADAVAFSRQALYTGSTFATNVVTVVTTNSVTPVKAYDLTITNQVLNGTCTGGVYHGVPSDGVWIFSGDKLNFTGTATGGAMRIVIE